MTLTERSVGIGRATAVAFARDGCLNIYLGDLSLAGLSETRDFIVSKYPRTNVIVSHVDISDETSVGKFYEGVVAAFGRIDFAANIAGYAHPANNIINISSQMYEASYNVNQRGVSCRPFPDFVLRCRANNAQTFLCQRAILRQMLKQDILDGYQCRGSIVNITSIAAKSVIPFLSAYSASKSGLLALSKTDALDYGPEGIRVNCVAPGNTETPMLDKAMGKEHKEANARVNPLRRNAQPEDIANAVVWLSSPLAAYITGIHLPVDGGQSLFTGHPHG